ncbi:MAG: L,D-transpeptidase family protein [Candidatus Nanopelagicales bacterium]|nr:L,D-transpeptidase family protein [Candidatus Nanopelagicales bacterium]
MLPLRLRALLVASAVLVGGAAAMAPATAASPFPDPPDIAAVTVPGAGSLQIAYVLPLNTSPYPVTDVQVTTNAGRTWSSCGSMTGLCVVGGLSNGVRYVVALRSVNAMGPSAPSASGSGVPQIPAGQDPDKIANLPRSRVMVGASFDGASNKLGVNASNTRVGVGTLPTLTFTKAIRNRAVVERHLSVVATSDATGATEVIPGRWAWQSDRSLMFRPTTFWPGRSTITITSTLDSTNLGVSGGTTLVGSSSLATAYTFKTARSFIARVDGKSTLMNVYIDGKKVKTFKVSLGGPDWRTRNGVKVVSTAKQADKTYTSQALGITDPNQQYRLEAKWNTRLTPSGEFMHAAPWAVGRIGRYNGSHGCTNMFESDAKWIFDTTIPGDVVVYTNTLGNLAEPGNGAGGLWNVSWADWIKKSALKASEVPAPPAPVPAPSIPTAPATPASPSAVPVPSASTVST